MWWLAVPLGSLAVAAAIRLANPNSGNTSKKKREKAAPDSTEPGEEDTEEQVPQPPAIWPYLARWGAILWGPQAEVDEPQQPVQEEEVERRRWITPSRVTGATMVVLVGVACWNSLAPSAAVHLTQQILIGALVGIGTNFIAITMLFQPAEPILGIQGVIPKNRETIIDSMAEGVARNLLDRETIRRAIHESNLVREGLDELIEGLRRLVTAEEFRSDVSELIQQTVRAFVQNAEFRDWFIEQLARIARHLPKKIAIIGKMLGVWLEEKVHTHGTMILAEVDRHTEESVKEMGETAAAWLKSLPDDVEDRREEIEAVLTNFVAEKGSQVDIEGMVKEKLQGFSPHDLEKFIKQATEEHLALLQYFGWVLGAAAIPAVEGFMWAVHRVFGS